MYRRFAMAVLLLAAAGVVGCSSGDSLMQEQIKLKNDAADATESGAPADSVTAIQKKLEQNHTKFEMLPDDEKNRLKEKYRDELAKANERYNKAMGGGGQMIQGTGGMTGFGHMNKLPAGADLPGPQKK